MSVADPRIGQRVGDYEIESLLGRGGMSVVYLAHHGRLKRKAAVKILSPELAEDPTFRARFVSEWERLAQLDHPNIIPVFEAGESEGLLYIAMRYVKTTDLRGLLEQEGRLEPDRAVSIVGQTASALDAAHEQSLVHRDVKPANILIAAGAGPDGTDHVYLSDFGLTKHLESHSGHTKTGHFMGTIDYVAPEQIAGKGVDGRTDQYALGCVLYECLTGKVPFPREEETAALFAHLQEPPPTATDLRPDLPPGVDEVLQRAMAKSAQDRFETCTAFARAAREALGLTVTPSTGLSRSPAVQTVLAAPPITMAPPATDGPTAPAVALPDVPAPPAPPIQTPMASPPPRRPSRNRRAPLVALASLGISAAIFAVTQLGGGGGGGGPGTTGSQPDVSPGVTLEVSDSFATNDAGWEDDTQNGITRQIVNDRYRFEITPEAAQSAFAVSVGGVGAIDVADQDVIATTILVDKGGGGLLHSWGVTCRYTGADGYYFLINSSGRWAIEKLVGSATPEILAGATGEPAIETGPGQTNVLEAHCVGGSGGTPATLTLIVNDQLIETVTDATEPIPSGRAGVTVTGQPGLVVEFEDFTLNRLTTPG